MKYIKVKRHLLNIAQVISPKMLQKSLLINFLTQNYSFILFYFKYLKWPSTSCFQYFLLRLISSWRLIIQVIRIRKKQTYVVEVVHSWRAFVTYSNSLNSKYQMKIYIWTFYFEKYLKKSQKPQLFDRKQFESHQKKFNVYQLTRRNVLTTWSFIRNLKISSWKNVWRIGYGRWKKSWIQK